MLNNVLAGINTTLVAVLVAIGIVVLVAAVVAVGVKIVKRKNPKKEEEKKEEKKFTPVEPKPVKTTEEIAKEKEEKTKKRAENEKERVSNHIKRISELGISKSPECYIPLDPNGVEAVGIIFNKNSKTYMFGPKGNKLNIGDVVIVKDLSGAERMVPVVVPNRMVNEADLVKPFKDIERVVYQTNKHVEYTAVEKKEEVVETVEEVVEEAPTFTITFNTLGRGEAPQVLSDLTNVPDELPLVRCEGFEFGGWTLDTNTNELVELGSKLEGDVTLYAVWEEIPAPVVEEAPVEEVKEEVVEEVVEATPTFTITFDVLGHGDAPEALVELTNVPDELPLVRCDGFEFGGWTLDTNSNELVELGSKLDDDVTLYAVWEEIPAPVVEEAPVEEVKEEEAVEETDDDSDDSTDEKESDTEIIYNAQTHTYTVIRKKRSFEGRICVASDDNKKFYNQVKNRLLSYGLANRISKTGEKFRLKRDTLAQIKFTSKQMVIYLALDPKQFENTKYKGKDVSEKKLYQDMPFQYKTKTERKTKWMLELIDLLAQNKGLVLNEKYADEDFAKNYPFMTEEELVEKGYLTITEKTVTEVVEEPEEETSEE